MMRMNKTLLTLVCFAIASSTMMANEHTLVFDGDNDIAGLKRQTTTNVNDMTFVDNFSFTEEGIDFSITKTDGTGKGFALVNAGVDSKGNDNSGIYISSYVDTKVTLTVPNGKITGAKICLSGYGAYNLEISFNGGNAVEYTSQTNNQYYYWDWSSKEGDSTLTIEWPYTFMARYIHSIEVTYTPDLGGKQECGLAFSQKSVEAYLGEAFTTPILINPNHLSVAWTSTDEKVATVDENGKVSLVGQGQTTIIASTEGNDEYAGGNAKYSLTVIPVAKSIAELMTMAPEQGNRVKVDFPVTVTFGSGIVAFVIDSNGTAGMIENIKDLGSADANPTTIYKVGNVIPGGWEAINFEKAEFIWGGIPPTVNETVEVTYPEVKSVTKEDADRVVILKNVTFDGMTAEGFGTVIGTTPDGTEYKFQNSYGAPTKPAGCYDVTCVVRYSVYGSTVYFWLDPIDYATESAVESVEAFENEAVYYDMQGNKVSNPLKGMFVKVMGEKAMKVVR